ncbi:MAG: glycosyltransferase family 39 protein [Anaerolineae bacterium]|nr:glycosyltransferase family 39 protein [Anaerolineae bacterium]
MMKNLSAGRIAALLLVLALTKSLLLALIITPSYGPDGGSYMRYIDAFENPDSEEDRWFIRGTTPIYPMFAYAFFQVGGAYFVVLVQILLGALVPAALFLALHSLNQRAALLTGILTALDPQTGLFFELVATEGLYIALLGLGTAAFFWSVQHKPTLWVIGGVGLLLGVGSFTRPVGSLLIVPYMFFFLLITRSIKRTTCLVVGYIAVYVALSLFNLWRFEFFAPGNSSGFYLATRLFAVGDLYSPENGAKSEHLFQLAQACDIELTDQRDESLKVTQDLRLCLIYTHGLSQVEISDLYQQVYSEAVRAKPMIFLKTMLTQVKDFLWGLSAPYDQDYLEGLSTNCDAEPASKNRWEAQEIFCPSPPRLLEFATPVLYWTMLGFSLVTLSFFFLPVFFLWRHSPPMIRWLYLYCLSLYAYHAVVTAAAGSILPRYITVTNVYLLITCAFVSVALHERWKNWQQPTSPLQSENETL